MTMLNTHIHLDETCRAEVVAPACSRDAWVRIHLGKHDVLTLFPATTVSPEKLAAFADIFNDIMTSLPAKIEEAA